MMTAWEALLWGIGGGVGAEALGLFRLRHDPHRTLPEYLRWWFYWLVTVGMVVIGGVIAVAYQQSGQELSPILSMNVGAASPLILERITGGFSPTPDAPIR